MEFWLVIALLVALGSAIFGVLGAVEQQRASAVKALAHAWGFDYCKCVAAPTDDGSAYGHIPDTVRQFQLFNKGRNRYLKNLIKGQRGDVEIYLGDYCFMIGRGKHRRTHHQTIIFIRSPHLELPNFLLTPENIFHKIGGLFGYDDIDFDSRPTFSARYLLKGTDETAIRDCFHDGILSFYERQEQVCSEGLGGFFLYYKPRHRVAPNDWKTLMGKVLEVHEQFVQC